MHYVAFITMHSLYCIHCFSFITLQTHIYCFAFIMLHLLHYIYRIIFIALHSKNCIYQMELHSLFVTKLLNPLNSTCTCQHHQWRLHRQSVVNIVDVINDVDKFAYVVSKEDHMPLHSLHVTKLLYPLLTTQCHLCDQGHQSCQCWQHRQCHQHH